MGPAEDGQLTTSLAGEAGWNEPMSAVELVGHPVSVVHGGAATATVSRRWPLMLAVITLFVDLVALACAYIVARGLVHGTSWDDGSVILGPISRSVLLTGLIWPVVFGFYGLYDLRRPTHATAELHRLFNAVVMSLLLVVVVTFVARIDISRDFFVALFVVGIATLTAGRLLTRRVGHLLNARAVTSQPTLIVGTNEEARALARTLRRRPWMGYRVVGFVDVTRSGLDLLDGDPVVGTVDDIAEITAEHKVQALIIAGSAAGAGTLQRIDAMVPPEVWVRVSPGLPNLGATRVVLEPIDGMALFSLRRHRFSRRQRLEKRTLDIALSSLAILVLSPVMLVLGLLVRITSPGPMVFRQQRVGEQGRMFTMFKFRSMRTGAHTERDSLVEHNEADGLLFKMRNDPRVTRIGRFLRRTSLDELPQLFNVLRGDMSLVGPRPALLDETTRYADEVRARLRVKPGVTGLWQVNGRHDLGFEDYVRYDLFYVENWSLTLDMYIIARTIPALLSGRGSY